MSEVRESKEIKKILSIFGNMKKLLISLFFFPCILFSQSFVTDEIDQIADSSYQIKQSIIITDEIEKLIEKHISIEKKKGGINGFSVYIYVGRNKQEAQRLKYKFERKFKDSISVIFERVNPNWKVKVGRFRTKLEAEKLQNSIQSSFPNCFISETIIKEGSFD